MERKWILEVLVVVLVVKLCALALSVSAWLVLQNQPADLLSLWNRWDYVAIARYGHTAVGEQRLFIFPPLFPLLAISCMYYARTRRWTLAGSHWNALNRDTPNGSRISARSPLRITATTHFAEILFVRVAWLFDSYIMHHPFASAYLHLLPPPSLLTSFCASIFYLDFVILSYYNIQLYAFPNPLFQIQISTNNLRYRTT